MKYIGLIIFVFISLYYNGCGGDTELNSVWRKQNINIDGNDSDWGNSLIPSDKINASVGMANDNDYLYICLSSDDREVKNKILSGGLTLWFQDSDNNGNKFGIFFPMGMSDTAMPEPDENIKPGNRHFDPLKLQENLLKSQTTLEIITANNDKIRIPVSELKDIRVKVALNNGKLVYEMRVPLNQKNSTTYALNADTGSVVRIGIESSTVNRIGFMPPDGRFDMPAGGDDGPGGGGFPPPGGMGREMFSSRPINFWINVKLASGK